MEAPNGCGSSPGHQGHFRGAQSTSRLRLREAARALNLGGVGRNVFNSSFYNAIWNSLSVSPPRCTTYDGSGGLSTKPEHLALGVMSAETRADDSPKAIWLPTRKKADGWGSPRRLCCGDGGSIRGRSISREGCCNRFQKRVAGGAWENQGQGVSDVAESHFRPTNFTESAPSKCELCGTSIWGDPRGGTKFEAGVAASYIQVCPLQERSRRARRITSQPTARSCKTSLSWPRNQRRWVA